MNGLRNFIELDNHSALDVGHLRKGVRPFNVKKKPKLSEDHSEVLREGTDGLTLRVEEVETLKACTNVDDIGEKVGDRVWWTQTGTPTARQVTKEFEGEELGRAVPSLQRNG